MNSTNWSRRESGLKPHVTLTYLPSCETLATGMCVRSRPRPAYFLRGDAVRRRPRRERRTRGWRPAARCLRPRTRRSAASSRGSRADCSPWGRSAGSPTRPCPRGASPAAGWMGRACCPVFGSAHPVPGATMRHAKLQLDCCSWVVPRFFLRASLPGSRPRRGVNWCRARAALRGTEGGYVQVLLIVGARDAGARRRRRSSAAVPRAIARAAAATASCPPGRATASRRRPRRGRSRRAARSSGVCAAGTAGRGPGR